MQHNITIQYYNGIINVLVYDEKNNLEFNQHYDKDYPDYYNLLGLYYYLNWLFQDRLVVNKSSAIIEMKDVTFWTYEVLFK